MGREGKEVSERNKLMVVLDFFCVFIRKIFSFSKERMGSLEQIMCPSSNDKVPIQSPITRRAGSVLHTVFKSFGSVFNMKFFGPI